MTNETATRIANAHKAIQAIRARIEAARNEQYAIKAEIREIKISFQKGHLPIKGGGEVNFTAGNYPPYLIELWGGKGWFYKIFFEGEKIDEIHCTEIGNLKEVFDIFEVT